MLAVEGKKLLVGAVDGGGDEGEQMKQKLDAYWQKWQENR